MADELSAAELAAADIDELCDAVVRTHDKSVADFAQGWIAHNSTLAAYLSTRGVSLTLLTQAVQYASRQVGTGHDEATAQRNVQAFVDALKAVRARLVQLEAANARLSAALAARVQADDNPY